MLPPDGKCSKCSSLYWGSSHCQQLSQQLESLRESYREAAESLDEIVRKYQSGQDLSEVIERAAVTHDYALLAEDGSIKWVNEEIKKLKEKDSK